jgi:hypothetical protein
MDYFKIISSSLSHLTLSESEAVIYILKREQNNINTLSLLRVFSIIDYNIVHKKRSFYITISDQYLQSFLSHDKFVELVINIYGKYIQENISEFVLFHIFNDIYFFNAVI